MSPGADAAPTPAWPAGLTGRGVAPLLALALALLGARLFALIDRTAVDVPFWDQWDLLDAFLADAGPWELFRWQHGPHRQGIAFPLVRALMDATAWNARAEPFLIGALVLLAAALALWLRRRLFGALTPLDVAIPLLLLTPAAVPGFVHIPNASHGAAPLLLLLLLGLACTIPARGARCAALVALGFPLVHTGFGLVAGAIVPVLLASECAEARRDGGARACAGPALGAALSLASLAIFFVGYRFDPAVDDFAFPSPRAAQYPAFAARMLANALGAAGSGPLGAIGSGLLGRLVGGAALAALVAVVALHGVRLFARTGPERRRSAAIASLAAFGLLFCAGTAIGRVSLGLRAAQASRYLPLVAPGILGLYLHLLSIRSLRIRLPAAALLALAIAAAGLRLRPDDRRFLTALALQKRLWVETYLETGSVQTADRRAGRPIYPHPPGRTRLDEKLAALRERRLGFFAERR